MEAVNPKGGRVNGSGKEIFTHVDQLPDVFTFRDHVQEENTLIKHFAPIYSCRYGFCDR